LNSQIEYTDVVYRLDHAVTKTQKTTLSAFNMDEGNVRYQAKEVGKNLREKSDGKKGA
jgi:hypothetical protein